MKCLAQKSVVMGFCDDDDDQIGVFYEVGVVSGLTWPTLMVWEKQL
jgi:hypothetical protein